MSQTIDDISIEYVEDGVTTVKQLDKEVLSKGAWTTILFKYQDWDGKKECYGPTRFTLRRYQKRNDQYHQKSKFNISSVEQAQKIIGVLSAWMSAEDEANT